jgi:hypothetical protein
VKRKARTWKLRGFMVEARNGDMLGPYKTLRLACAVLDCDATNKRVVPVEIREIPSPRRAGGKR